MYDFKTNLQIFRSRNIKRLIARKFWPPRSVANEKGVIESRKFDDEKQEYLVGVGLISHFPTASSNSSQNDTMVVNELLRILTGPQKRKAREMLNSL